MKNHMLMVAGGLAALVLALQAMPAVNADSGSGGNSTCDQCCSNSGVQVVVGNYNCAVQYCDPGTGAGAGAGAGGPGQSGATAGATAGTTCTNNSNNGGSGPGPTNGLTPSAILKTVGSYLGPLAKALPFALPGNSS